MTVAVEDGPGAVDSAFNGPVTLHLSADPGGAVLGGTLTVNASGGLADFQGLTINQAGTGYEIQASSGSLESSSMSINISADTSTPTPTSTPTSTSSVAPATVIGQQPVFRRKLNRRGKPVGRAVLSGFTLDFSGLLNPSAASNAADYRVDMFANRRGRHILRPITNFRVSYSMAGDAVTISLGKPEKFAAGGQIAILGAVSDAPGGALNGPTVFTISRGGKSLTPG